MQFKIQKPVEFIDIPSSVNIHIPVDIVTAPNSVFLHMPLEIRVPPIRISQRRFTELQRKVKGICDLLNEIQTDLDKVSDKTKR